jgi:TolB protein
MLARPASARPPVFRPFAVLLLALSACSPAPTPATGRLAFASKRTGNYELFLVHTDGTGLRALTTDPAPAVDLYPAWSPDGKRIAFGSDRGGGLFAIYLLDVESGAITAVTTGVKNATAPAWSPDGATLVFEGSASDSAAPDIYAVPVDGGQATRLTTDPARDAGPTFSPDGKTIYFVSNRASGYAVWAMDASGANQRAVAGGSAILGRPAVSPDGKTIAFARLTPSQVSAVVLLDIAAGNARTLTAQDDSEPAFSPRGDRLAITSLRYGNPEVLIVEAADGSVAARLTSDPAIDGAPAFAPDPE